jgi:hypothetical protein
MGDLFAYVEKLVTVNRDGVWVVQQICVSNLPHLLTCTIKDDQNFYNTHNSVTPCMYQ